MHYFKNLTLKNKIRLLLIACGAASFAVMICAAATFLAMTAWNTTKHTEDIGAKILTASDDSLWENDSKALMRIARFEADAFDTNIEFLQRITDNMAWQMTDICTHPEKYTPRSSYTTEKRNSENLHTFVQILPNASAKDLQDELSLALNIEPHLINNLHFLTENSQEPDDFCMLSVAAESGFCISLVRLNEDSPLFSQLQAKASHHSDKETDWYKEAKGKKSASLFQSFDKTMLDAPLMTCTAPYCKDGNFTGVVSISWNAKYFPMGSNIKAEDFIFLLKNDGNILFSKQEDSSFSTGKNLLENLQELKGLEDLETLMASQKEFFRTFDVGQTNCLLIAVPLKNMDGFFCRIIDLSRYTGVTESNRTIIQNTIDSNNRIVREHMKQSAWHFACIIFAIFALLLFVGYHLTFRFVRPLQSLMDGAKAISQGLFGQKIQISSGDEIEDAAHAFNQMSDKLEQHLHHVEELSKERAKIQSDLDHATHIQLSQLPKNFDWKNRGIELYATMDTAKEVGGDFYDFYWIDEKRLLLTIADVSGKGIPAALFMMRSKTVLNNYVTMMAHGENKSLASAISAANDVLCQENEEMLFVTAFLALLDTETGKLTCVNAGHNPPLLFRASEQKYQYLQQKKNLILGMMDSFDFVQEEFLLQKGDVLYLYTDGVTEAMNEEKEQYGEAKLLACLNDGTASDLKGLLESVNKSIKEHAGNAEQSDDITMLAMRFLKN